MKTEHERPSNLFNAPLREIKKRGYAASKIEMKDLKDGDLIQMSNDGTLWCEVDNAKYLRTNLKTVNFIDIWRQKQ